MTAGPPGPPAVPPGPPAVPPPGPPAVPSGPTSPGHPEWIRGQLDQMLNFCAAAADWQDGGFDGLTTTGRRQPGPKRLYATARMTYGFTLGFMLGRPGCAELAEHGLRALRAMFHDDAHGGWFAELTEDGRKVTVARKETYGHAFVLLAAATAAQAGWPAGDLLQEAADIFGRWLYDDSAGLCLDSWDEAWQEPDSYRGINANMHAVEAFLAAYHSTGQAAYLRQARAISSRVISFAAAQQWRIPEHFTADWLPLPDFNADRPGDGFRPFGATPGHGLEWARLLLQLRLTPDSDAGGLLAAAAALFRRAVADGWDARRCGFAYTVDWQGREVSSQRLHWPLAEAIGAARYLEAATGQPGYADWSATFWRVADRCFIDRRGGSWWHEVGPDGRPAATIWPGKSDLYHVLNALLLSLLPPGPTVAAGLAARGR